MKLRRITIWLGPALLFGCTHTKPQAIILPARTAVSASPTTETKTAPIGPLGTAGNVRASESVKVYGMNRYVDPGDPRVLHERHAIYRVEQQPSWITQSDRNQNAILLGPVLGLRNPRYAPEPLPGETARDVAQNKQNLQEATRDIHLMQENQEKLATTVQSLAEQTLEAQRKLATAVSTLNGRVKKLEGNSDAAEGSGAASENKLPPAGVVVRSGE
jgi:type IV secretory pathway VirB10-like protein